MDYKSIYQSPLGTIILASDGKNLTGLWFEGQKYFGSTLHNEVEIIDNLPIFNETKKWLSLYFKGENPNFELPIQFNDTDFRIRVWNILLSIPYGSTMTYKEIGNLVAKQTGKISMSAQAIGGAVGHNPISIIIPCHRVIGTNKSLTGYAGGIDRKIKLLELEAFDTSKLVQPSKSTAR